MTRSELEILKANERLSERILELENELSQLKAENRSKWITITNNFRAEYRYACKKCDYQSGHKYNYCCHCGAKMDKE